MYHDATVYLNITNKHEKGTILYTVTVNLLRHQLQWTNFQMRYFVIVLKYT